MFIKFHFSFMSGFAFFNPHVLSCSFSVPLLVQIVQPCRRLDLLEVPMTYLGSVGYFLACGPVLPNGCSSERLMLMRRADACILLHLV
jgi:hypothetical protein